MRKLLATLATALAFVALTPGSSHAASNVAWATPNLSQGFTPQGMTTWGKYVVMAEYKAGSNTRLVAVNPTSGKTYGQVSIAETHAGGIAFANGFLFMEDAPRDGGEQVRLYVEKTLDAAFTASHKAGGHPVYVKSAGLQDLGQGRWASIMTSKGTTLYAGHHGVGSNASMQSYSVAANGKLTLKSSQLIPELAQGAAFYGGQLIITAGGGHMYVAGVERSIPSHAQGVAVIKGVAYVAFENGGKNVLKFTL